MAANDTSTSRSRRSTTAWAVAMAAPMSSARPTKISPASSRESVRRPPSSSRRAFASKSLNMGRSGGASAAFGPHVYVAAVKRR